MRYLAFIPASIVLLAVIIITAAHPTHAPEIILACEITGAITVAAAIALVAANKASAITVAQVALGAITGQMMLTIFSAVIVWAAKLTSDFRIFALWLLAFYWLNLLVLTPIAIRIIRAAGAHAKEPAVKSL